MKTKEPVRQNNKELKDEELNQVNGGMKIVLVDKPKIFAPLLRLIFKLKREK